MEWMQVAIKLNFLLMCLPHTTFGQFVGPDDTSVLLGGTALLTCSNSEYTGPGDGAAQWSQDGTPFGSQRDGIYTNPVFAKYSNFRIISTTVTEMNLEVTNAEIEDHGVYECVMGLNPLKSATLSVEIEGNDPTISRDGDTPGSSITLRASEQSVLRGTARGFRPAVNLEWYRNNVRIMTGISEDAPTSNGDGTNDTSGTLTLTPTRQDDGATVECRTTGQMVAPAKRGSVTLNVQYVPVVTVTYPDGRITCSADANPLATSYDVILNGTQILKSFPTSGQSVEYVPEFCTTFSCNATNTIGTGTGVFNNNEPVCPGYVEPTTTPATKSTPTTKSPQAGQGLDTGAIIGIAVGVLVVVCIVIIGIIICYKKKIFCFDNNKTSNSTSPKKQPSAKNADMIRNQPEVRQSVHNYDDEPKKPRVPRSNSGKPAAAAAAVPPEKEALRQNPPPHSKDRDHQNYPMDSRDGGPEHGGQAGINYADLEFQNRQGATNGHGRVHPREDEPTQYASILV